MPWKYFQWKRWMALKKILCICLQNRAQGLDKDREPGTLSLQSKDSNTCAAGTAALALPGLQQYHRTQLVWWHSQDVSAWIANVPQGNYFLTQMEALSASPGGWGHMQNTTHPQAPEMNPSSFPLQGSKLRAKCHYPLWTMYGHKDWTLRN